MKRRPQSALYSDQSVAQSQILRRKVPINVLHDKEDLYIESLQLKQQLNDAKSESMKLRSQIIQLQKKVFNLERVDKLQSGREALGMTGSGEGSILPLLKAKINEQKDELDQLRAELQRQYRSVKLTSQQEMQKEIKEQNDEIFKLKQILVSALKIQEQDLFNEPDIQSRLQNLSVILNAQENQIVVLQSQLSKAQKELQDTQAENQELQEIVTTLQFEKSQLKQQLNESNMTEDVQYQIKKSQYLEKKLQETLQQTDSLKGELSLSEGKLRTCAKQLTDLEREYKTSQMENQRRKQGYEQQISKKDYLIQELEERVQIIEILKSKTQQSPKLEESPLRLIPPKTYREFSSQYPEVVETANTKPINQQRLEVLQQILRQKLIRQKLSQPRLQAIYPRNYIQLKDGIIYFMEMPFGFGAEDALLLARYYIAEDQGKSDYIQMEDTQEMAQIYKQFTKLVGDINFRIISNEASIIRKVQNIYNQTNLKDSYTAVDYKKILKSLNIDIQQYILLVNYEQTGKAHLIDHKLLQWYFKYEYQQLLHYNTMNSFDYSFSYVPPVKEVHEITPRAQTSIVTTNQIQDKASLKMIISEPVLTMSQIRSQDIRSHDLKSSESRKPSDIFNYTQSNIQSNAQFSKRTFDPFKDSVNFNLEESSFQSPIKLINQFNSEITRPPVLKNTPISEFQEEELEEEIIENL